MKVEQIYSLVNTVTQELLGETIVLQEDLSNIVQVGETFENVVGFDKYVKAISDKVGKVVFVDRIYKGRIPSVLMDGWEYGSILEKISAEMPDAIENESWELQDGTSYDQNIFYQPKVSVGLWNHKITFEIPLSITEKAIKSSFQSAEDMRSFLSTIKTSVENSMTKKTEALVMRTINNLMALTISKEFGDNPLSGGTGVKAVNLLYRYNNEVNEGTALTVDKALQNTDFLKFAAMEIGNYSTYIQSMSTLFNIGGKERFTPLDSLHLVMLSKFKKAADVYLQSNTFHEEYTALPNAETVAFWQGSGVDFNFPSVSKIHVKTTLEGNPVTVETSGILCTMFDRNALGVSNQDPRVTTNYNAKGEFWNEYHKYDAHYFNDINENMVVFFIA